MERPGKERNNEMFTCWLVINSRFLLQLAGFWYLEMFDVNFKQSKTACKRRTRWLYISAVFGGFMETQPPAVSVHLINKASNFERKVNSMQ